MSTVAVVTFAATRGMFDLNSGSSPTVDDIYTHNHIRQRNEPTRFFLKRYTLHNYIRKKRHLTTIVPLGIINS